MSGGTHQHPWGLRWEGLHPLTRPLRQLRVPKGTGGVWVILGTNGSSSRCEVTKSELPSHPPNAFLYHDFFYLKMSLPGPNSPSWTLHQTNHSSRLTCRLSSPRFHLQNNLHGFLQVCDVNFAASAITPRPPSVSPSSSDQLHVFQPPQKDLKKESKIFTSSKNPMCFFFSPQTKKRKNDQFKKKKRKNDQPGLPSVLRKLMLKGCDRKAEASKRRRRDPSSASTLSLWRLPAALPASSARPAAKPRSNGPKGNCCFLAAGMFLVQFWQYTAIFQNLRKKKIRKFFGSIF